MLDGVPALLLARTLKSMAVLTVQRLLAIDGDDDKTRLLASKCFPRLLNEATIPLLRSNEEDDIISLSPNVSYLYVQLYKVWLNSSRFSTAKVHEYLSGDLKHLTDDLRNIHRGDPLELLRESLLETRLFEEIKSRSGLSLPLISSLSDSSHPMFVITDDTNQPQHQGESYLPSLYFKLRCYNGTTHCRIRKEPSLQSQEVDVLATGCIIRASGMANGFLALYDGRGYVKQSVEDAMVWERLGGELSIPYEHVDALLSRVTEERTRRVCTELIFKILGNFKPFFSNLVLRSVDLFLLSKLSGYGEIDCSNIEKARGVSLRQALIEILRSDSNLLLCGEITNLFLSQIVGIQRILASDRFIFPPVNPGEPEVVTVETDHSYSNDMDQTWKISIAGANGLEIVFDERSSTEKNCDFLTFYSDDALNDPISVRLSGNCWPGVAGIPPLVFEGLDTCFARFQSDSNNVDWGFKFTAISSIRPLHAVELKYTEPICPLNATQKLSRPSLLLALEMYSILLDSPFGQEILFISKNGEEMIDKIRIIAKIIPSFHPKVISLFSTVLMRLIRIGCTASHLSSYMTKSLAALAYESIAFANAASTTQKHPMLKPPSSVYQAIVAAAVFGYLFIESRKSSHLDDSSMRESEGFIVGPKLDLQGPDSSDQTFIRIKFTGVAAIGLLQDKRCIFKWHSDGAVEISSAPSKKGRIFVSDDIICLRIFRPKHGIENDCCSLNLFRNGVEIDTFPKFNIVAGSDWTFQTACYGASDVRFFDLMRILSLGYLYLEDECLSKALTKDLEIKSAWTIRDGTQMGILDSSSLNAHLPTENSSDHQDNESASEENSDENSDEDLLAQDDIEVLEDRDCRHAEDGEVNTPWPYRSPQNIRLVQVSALCSISLHFIRAIAGANVISFGLLETENDSLDKVPAIPYFGADDRSWGAVCGAQGFGNRTVSFRDISRDEIFHMMYDRFQGCLYIARADDQESVRCLHVHHPNAPEATLWFGALDYGGYELKILDRPFPRTAILAHHHYDYDDESDGSKIKCFSLPRFSSTATAMHSLPTSFIPLVYSVDILLAIFDRCNWRLRRSTLDDPRGFTDFCCKMNARKDTIFLKKGESLDKQWAISFPDAEGYYVELAINGRLPTPIDLLSIDGDSSGIGWTLEHVLVNSSSPTQSSCLSFLDVGDNIVRTDHPSSIGTILSIREDESVIICVDWLHSSTQEFVILPVSSNTCYCRALVSAGLRLCRKSCLKMAYVPGKYVDIKLKASRLPADVDISFTVTPILSRVAILFDDNYASERENYASMNADTNTIDCIINLLNELRIKHNWSTEEILSMSFEKLWQFSRELPSFSKHSLHDESIASKNFDLVKDLNVAIESSLSMIDLSLNAHYTISHAVSLGRGLIFPNVKKPFIDRGMNRSQNRGSRFQLAISRSRALKYKQQGLCDQEGRWSIFGQVFRRISTLPPSALRRPDQLWETIIAGERAHDLGGPYREVWTSMSEELMSSSLPLLQVSPNGDYFIPNSLARSPVKLQMFEFLGKLIGAAARGSLCMELNLAPPIWRAILGLELKFSDWIAVDRAEYHVIERIRYLDENDFKLAFGVGELTFSSKTLSGERIELIRGGFDKFVMWIDRAEYCDMVLKAHIKEFDLAISNIRQGLSSQLPPAVLSLLTWRELEEMVCGRPDLDVSSLKSITTYSGYSPLDQQMQWLWEILEEFNVDERKSFLKFISGRSRLPTKASKNVEFKVQLLFKDAPDHYLPVAHTCFFSIDIPRYSTKDVMRDKLLYSIYHCIAIDADENDTGMRYYSLILLLSTVW